MGLTKRKDSYYVAFPVLTSEDGKTLRLARGVNGAKLKRWKVGTLNKTYLSLETVKGLRTYKDRVERVNGQLVPYFGKKILTEIKPQDVEAYRAQRAKKDGSTASLQTVNNDHTALKHCLNVAVRRGLLVSNPAAKVPMPNPENERDRVLSEVEWSKLYAAAKPHLQPILLLAYHLGQRFSEIMQLTWDRVDLKRGFILLRTVDTKTKQRREFPLTPAVRATLHKLAKVRNLKSTRVFLYKGKPIDRVSRAFKSALKGAGISDFRFHDLRHCGSTNYGEPGWTRPRQCGWLGISLRRCGSATTQSRNAT